MHHGIIRFGVGGHVFPISLAEDAVVLIRTLLKIKHKELKVTILQLPTPVPCTFSLNKSAYKSLL